MSNNKKPHGFCETPHEKCTMSYCDENGCINRKRNLVGEPIEMSNNKQSSVEWLTEQLTAKIQMWNSTKNYQEFHIVLEAGEFANLIEQAKAMHETEHFNTWWHEISENEPISFKQYYNETFGE